MRRRRKNRKQVRMVIGLSICLLLIMTVGYAAFSTNIILTAKGNIKDYNAAWQLKKNIVTSGDGLYLDTYEEGRYIYRGGTPNNYITFNGEKAGWRILSVEADGTIKIIRDKSIGDKSWDSSNSKDWNRPATLNTYLNNDYYNSLTEEAKKQITTGTYKIGLVSYSDTNLEDTVKKENSITWNGNIALITASEYVRASNNSVCTSANVYYGMSSCYNNGSTHNWLTKIMNLSTNKYSWLLSSGTGASDAVLTVHSIGRLSSEHAKYITPGVVPVIYLKSDIQLSGEGTEDNPYTIK